MSPQYGNHIGIIINSLDPEGRGRVQVFIPHLSTTLFNQWNVNAQDIKLDAQTFQEYVKQDNPIGKSLRENLPWAEAARPLLGSGGTTIVGRNGKTEPAATPTTLDSQLAENVKLGSIKPGAPSGVPKIDPFEPDLIPNDPTVEGAQIPVSTIPGKDGLPMCWQWNGSQFEMVEGSKARSGTFPYEQYAGRDQNGNPKYITILHDKIDGQVTRVEPKDAQNKFIALATENWSSIQKDLIGNRSPNQYYNIDTPTKYVNQILMPIVKQECDFYNSQPFMETTGTNKGYISYGFGGLSVGNIKQWSGAQPSIAASYGISSEMDSKVNITDPDTGIPAMMMVVQGNLRQNPQSSLENALVSFGGLTKNAVTAANNGKPPSYAKNPINGIQTSSQTLAAGKVTSGARRSGPIDKSTFGKGANYQLPQGSNSVPQPGNMVWVFFLNGDLQKPVYFASVTEAYANARDQAVPVSPPAEVRKQLAEPPPHTTEDLGRAANFFS